MEKNTDNQRLQKFLSANLNSRFAVLMEGIVLIIFSTGVFNIRVPIKLQSPLLNN